MASRRFSAFFSPLLVLHKAAGSTEAPLFVLLGFVLTQLNALVPGTCLQAVV